MADARVDDSPQVHRALGLTDDEAAAIAGILGRRANPPELYRRPARPCLLPSARAAVCSSDSGERFRFVAMRRDAIESGDVVPISPRQGSSVPPRRLRAWPTRESTIPPRSTGRSV